MNGPRRNMAEMLNASQRAFIQFPETTPKEPDGTSERPSPQGSASDPQSPEHATSAPRPLPRRLHAPKQQEVTLQRREALRSVTLRLRASVAEALRRASIERSLDYAVPYTQQAIVEIAVREWLRRAGHEVD